MQKMFIIKLSNKTIIIIIIWNLLKHDFYLQLRPGIYTNRNGKIISLWLMLVI